MSILGKLEFITCESGDWEVIKINGKVYYEGHSIPSEVWLSILNEFHEIKNTEITDDEMEAGIYNTLQSY